MYTYIIKWNFRSKAFSYPVGTLKFCLCMHKTLPLSIGANNLKWIMFFLFVSIISPCCPSTWNAVFWNMRKAIHFLQFFVSWYEVDRHLLKFCACSALFFFAATRKVFSFNLAYFEEVTQEASWPLKVSASIVCIFRSCLQKTTVLFPAISSLMKWEFQAKITAAKVWLFWLPLICQHSRGS